MLDVGCWMSDIPRTRTTTIVRDLAIPHSALRVGQSKYCPASRRDESLRRHAPPATPLPPAPAAPGELPTAPAPLPPAPHTNSSGPFPAHTPPPDKRAVGQKTRHTAAQCSDAPRSVP